MTSNRCDFTPSLRMFQPCLLRSHTLRVRVSNSGYHPSRVKPRAHFMKPHDFTPQVSERKALQQLSIPKSSNQLSSVYIYILGGVLDTWDPLFFILDIGEGGGAGPRQAPKYPEPFVLLKPPAQNVGCCCVVASPYNSGPPKTSRPFLNPPWNRLDPPRQPWTP